MSRKPEGDRVLSYRATQPAPCAGPIGTKSTNLEEDLEYLLPVKFREILCGRCRGDVENVKSLRQTDDDDDDDDGRRTDDGRRAMTIAHLSFAQVS